MARRVLTDLSVKMQNLQGWRLCAEGANVAVVRILCITESGTGSGLKRRIERRVRRKICRSVVSVNVNWLDLEDDPSLALLRDPGLVIVFEGELVDVLICTFSGITNDLAAYT